MAARGKPVLGHRRLVPRPPAQLRVGQPVRAARARLPMRARDQAAPGVRLPQAARARLELPREPEVQ